MSPRFRVPSALFVAGVLAAAFPARAPAWGGDGHRAINRLALDALPADFPAFAKADADKVVFFAAEPDHWRSSKDPAFLHSVNGDHVIDIEQLTTAGFDLATLTPYRYEFAAQFPAARAAHADQFPALVPAKDRNHEYQWPGFLPWAINEHYGRLRELFSQWKVYRQYGTPAEVADMESEIVECMGETGHFVGDGSQPLHVTVHHHGWDCFGWKAPNPNGYSTRGGIHDWIDSGFIAKAGITAASLESRVVPAEPLDVAPRPDGRDPVFDAVVAYLVAQNRQVEPLYQLDQEGKFKADGTPGSLDGKPFVEEQLLRGARMLARVWLTAWRQAGPNVYLQSELVKRGPPAP